VQTLWVEESLVEARQAEIRREVEMCRRRAPRSPEPAAPWRVRLGWRLVEIGLRLALPGPERAAGLGVLPAGSPRGR
jgi:hypothetical protein